MVLGAAGGWVRLGVGAFAARASLSAAQRPLNHASRFGNSFGWAGLSGSFAQARPEVTEQ